jgi:hypothetical protein
MSKQQLRSKLAEAEAHMARQHRNLVTMAQSRRRFRDALRSARAEVCRLKIEIAALGPIIAAAKDLRRADTWQRGAACESDDDAACDAVDRAIDAVCAAVDVRQSGEPPPASEVESLRAEVESLRAQLAAHGDALLAGFVPDAPAQDAEDVAVFLTMDAPGDEVAG